MTSDSFAYWLQGFMEMENPKTLNAKQTQMIKDHLKQVFKKKTPNIDGYSNGFDDKDVFIPKKSSKFPKSTLIC